MLPPFNILGAVMLVGCFGLAFGILRLCGLSTEFPLVILGGFLSLLCDGLYRWKRLDGHWFWPSCGGSLCYLPVWLFGVAWVLGHGIRAMVGEEHKDLVSGLVIGGLAIVVIGVWAFQLASAHTPSAPPAMPFQEWECSRCGHKNPARAARCTGCGLST